MFAEHDKHYPSRSGQTSLATAVANITKPVTKNNFGPSTLLPYSLRNEVWRKLLSCICKHVSSCTCLIFQGPLSSLSLNADLCGLHTSTCPLLTRQKQFNVFAVMRPPHVPILLLFGHCPHDPRFSIMNKTESTCDLSCQRNG